MEDTEENKPDAREEALRDFITDKRTENRPKISLKLRIAGLALLLMGLGIMMLWQKGMLMPLYKTVAYCVGGAGMGLYLIGRIAALKKALKPLHHAAASACFAAGTWAVTGSSALTLANFAAGTLIDLDHFPEFFWHTRFKKGPFAILREQLHLTATHTILPLHSLDLLTLLFYLLYAAGHAKLALALYLGCVQHLVLDTIYNPVKSPFAYFLSFRIRCGFRTDRILHRIDLRKNGN